jgi:hypothetical protein
LGFDFLASGISGLAYLVQHTKVDALDGFTLALRQGRNEIDEVTLQNAKRDGDNYSVSCTSTGLMIRCVHDQSAAMLYIYNNKQVYHDGSAGPVKHITSSAYYEGSGPAKCFRCGFASSCFHPNKQIGYDDSSCPILRSNCCIFSHRMLYQPSTERMCVHCKRPHNNQEAQVCNCKCAERAVLAMWPHRVLHGHPW